MRINPMDAIGRETFLVKVDWLDDWPVFNEGKNIKLLTQGRDSRPGDQGSCPDNDSVWRADLTKSGLELGWYQKSKLNRTSHQAAILLGSRMLTPVVFWGRIDTPLKQSYSLTERPGYLRLYGNCYNLSSPEAPAMLLRKQTMYEQSFGVTLEFNPSRVGYEAGLVLWWNQFSYATIGVTLVQLPSGEKVHSVVRRSPTGRAGVVSVSPSRHHLKDHLLPPNFHRLPRTVTPLS